MKKLLLPIILFSPLLATSQTKSIGFSFGYSSDKAIDFDIFYRKNHSRFHVGATAGRNGAKGKRVKERLNNYGNTTSGSNNYVTTFDIGYSYFIWEGLNIKVDGEIGSRSYYLNYNDGRFNGGGYHIVYDSEFAGGGGAYLGYLFGQVFEFYGGYSNLRGAGGGMRLNIPIQ